MRSLKQLVKEKVTKTDQKTLDTEQYRHFRKEFHELEDYLDKSVKNTRSFCQKFEATTKIQDDMGEFLKESGLQQSATNSDEMAELMLKVGESVKSLSTIHHAMLVNLVEKYIQPSMKFQTSMKSVQTAHKKYCKKRLDTDGQVIYCKQMSMKDPAKLDQEKLRLEREKLKAMEQERDDAFDESVEAHVDLFVKKRTTHVTDFCEIIQSFHHFYAEGYTLTHNMLEYMEKMKHKAKDSAETLKKTPIDRVRTFDPDGGVSPASPSPSSSSSSANSISSPVLVSHNTSTPTDPPTSSTLKKTTTITTTSKVTAPKALFQTIALYDYDAQQSNELSFVAGDTINVTSKDDPDGWWDGYLDRDPSKVGSFPSNYTKAGSVEDGGSKSSSSSSGNATTGKDLANALYDYSAEDDGELSFKTGDRILVLERLDGGWWRGKNQSSGLVGLFPSNFTDQAEG
jgi:hypothetical protein